MTEPVAASPAEPSAEPHDIRLRRLRMRSWRRGMREMDLLLGPYSEAELAALSAEVLDDYERMLSENDQDLYLWLTKGTGAPEAHVPVLRRIAAFHRIAWGA